MPNGHDKNLRRLLMACAAYRRRYGQWPTHARLGPLVLSDLARLLDPDSFERLALHMELRTTTGHPLSVGGAPGYVEYGTRDFPEDLGPELEQAEKWLNVEAGEDDAG
jgi:hypothetical protein